jgi:hypothetical protein
MTEHPGVLDAYHLGEVLKKSAKKLGERCSGAAVALLICRLSEYLGTPANDKYSYIWRPSIEGDSPEHHRDDSRVVVLEALRDAALGAASVSPSDALTIAKLLLESPYPTIVRVGIYVCGNSYGNAGAAFWDAVKIDWFIDFEYWEELFRLINKNYSRFSIAERSQYLGIIDRLKRDWQDESRQQEWDETHKRDRLFPAFEQGDPEVDKLYLALAAKWGPSPGQSEPQLNQGGGFVKERSPVAPDALLKMSDDDMVRYLSEFEPDSNVWDGPSYRGLASTLSAAVRSSEDGFSQRIHLFSGLAHAYQHGILRGLKERWSEDKREINWSAAIDLMQSISTNPAFKLDLAAEATTAFEPNLKWVICDFVDLLKSALGSERHMPTELYKHCSAVLRTVLEGLVPIEAGRSQDAVSTAINTPRGRALEAYILLSLAMRREEVAINATKPDIWELVAPVFNAELLSSELGLNEEFATLVGIYCVNLHYINAEWIDLNFDRLFSTANETAWRCAAQGFAYQQYLYDWLYKRLLTGGHLQKMVSLEGLPDNVYEKALQFVGLAYLNGMESLHGEGLLSGLIVHLKVRELSRLCWYFWTFRSRDDKPSQNASKILEYWLAVSERIRLTGENVPTLQSELSKLASFVQQITPEVSKAFLEAAPHAQVRHHGHYLLGNLSRLVGAYPREVSAIFRAALTGFLPEYRTEDLVKCISGLYESGEVDNAEWICNTYADRGSQLLSEVYKQWREKLRTFN